MFEAAKKLRYSRQREEVLRALQSTNTHPDAEWIYGEVQKNVKSISMGTVYRNLKELHDCGDILMFEAGGVMHFDGNNRDHIHFVCRKCGRIIDIFRTSGLKAEIESAGHKVDCENVIMFGRCSDCNWDGDCGECE